MTATNDKIAPVVEKLIAQIEAGADTWQMPWNFQASTFPINASTGKAYRGGNVIACWVEALDKGYAQSKWATYKQWAALGGQVRKGERGLHLVKWSLIVKTDEQGRETKRMIPNAFVVFNVAQVDGIEAAPADAPVRHLPDEFKTMVAAIDYVQAEGAPAYWPTFDRITMPPVAAFNTVDDYCSTLAHELAHWTGHKDRLNREYGKRFGDEAYAAEELVAELSSAFTCQQYGIQPAKRNDHAAYLAHWVTMLRSDPSILWTVASKAQAASDFIIAGGKAAAASEPADEAAPELALAAS